MILQVIDKDFSILKVKQIPQELLEKDFVFVSKTDKELSVICETKYLPDGVLIVEHDWKCIRIAEDASF